jgi:outer membrane protein
MKKILIAILTVMVVLPVMGQKEWSLEDCIRFAVENNLELKQSVYETQVAEQNYRQSKWYMTPSIGASSSAGYSIGKTVVEGELVSDKYFYSDYSIGATINLFSGFSIQNQISYYKFKKAAAENSNIDAIDNLAFQVMNSFYDVIYYEELLKIVTEQKELSVVNLKKTEVMVNTGLKATADLLEVNSNFEMDELICIQTKNKLESSWINLRRALNLNPDSTIYLKRNNNVVFKSDVESDDASKVFNEYSIWSPQLGYYENNQKASKKYLSMQKAGFFPSLSASASLGSYFYPTDINSDFSYQINTNQSKYVGLSLNIPIFRRNTNITNVKLAKLQYESAKTKLDQVRQDLYFTIVTNINDLKASEAEFAQARKQLDADTLAYRAAEKKYDQGMINVVDFYTVKNRMSSTCAQVLRSELTAEIKRRIIEFYRGNRFWEK